MSPVGSLCTGVVGGTVNPAFLRSNGDGVFENMTYTREMNNGDRGVKSTTPPGSGPSGEQERELVESGSSAVSYTCIEVAVLPVPSSTLYTILLRLVTANC
jgi:hypothetical protein